MAPEHGENTGAILLELSYKWDTIANLRSRGIIP